MINFSKYHALGNDYIVIHPAHLQGELTPAKVRLICNRHYGVGSDGILLGPLESEASDFGLRIFNPDGSEVEKSGNGLRIFARSLVDEALTTERSFTVETPGGAVACEVSDDGRSVKVEMGTVHFDSTIIPVAGPPREVLNETIVIDGRKLTFCAATIGNPHCIVLSQRPSPVETRRYGPQIENDPRFPKRTNVQFMRVLDRANIQIEIWERGAGYTLASGSSSTVAAAVAHRLGLCDSQITVHMPGGRIAIQFDENLMATMTGPVSKICDGSIAGDLLNSEFLAP
jgi:diaminopimelate epimerase